MSLLSRRAKLKAREQQLSTIVHEHQAGGYSPEELELLARKVYRLLQQELQLERDRVSRRGIGRRYLG